MSLEGELVFLPSCHYIIFNLHNNPMTGFTDKLDWYLSHQVLPESHISVFKCDEKVDDSSITFFGLSGSHSRSPAGLCSILVHSLLNLL